MDSKEREELIKKGISAIRSQIDKNRCWKIVRYNTTGGWEKFPNESLYLTKHGADKRIMEICDKAPKRYKIDN